MSRPFSRPRTRIYDVNYNIGENYYRTAIDRLDRKYSGRPASPSPRQASIPKEISERHELAFADEDINTARARAQKHIKEANLFDSRGGVITSRALELAENDIDEETASKLQRIRANKKVSVIDDIDMDSTMNTIVARRLQDRADKMLDSVGITKIDKTSKPSQDIVYQRRALKITVDATTDNDESCKWSKLTDLDVQQKDTAATIRARQSRARLNELEDEMNEMAEKAQVRERKAARLRALVAETAENNEASTVQTKRIVSRQKREAIEF